MYSALNTLSEYIYFYISKNITSYTFLLVFKIVEGRQCTLKIDPEKRSGRDYKTVSIQLWQEIKSKSVMVREELNNADAEVRKMIFLIY